MKNVYYEFLILVAVIYSIMAFGIPAVVSWDTGISYALLFTGVCSYLWIPLAVTLAAFLFTMMADVYEKMKQE